MPYALLDDQYHSNPKVIAMGLEGAGLYSRALSYCADYLTDGLVPLEWATAVVGRKKKLLDHLTHVGAWQRVHIRDRIVYTDRAGNEHELVVKVEGFWIADYTMFNPSRSEYESTRKRKSHAGRKGAVTRWGDSCSHGTSHGSSDSTSHDETARGDVEKLGETMAGAMALATPPARAPARAPSPTPVSSRAVAGSTQPPAIAERAEPDERPAAAVNLDTLNPNPEDAAFAANAADPVIKLVLELRDRDAGTEHTIRSNFGGLPEAAFAYTLEEVRRCRPDTASDAGLAITILQRIADTGLIGDEDTPTPNGSDPQQPVDQPTRRRRYVEANGWRLPPDELEYQLTEMGADEDELVGLLETAADLRHQVTA